MDEEKSALMPEAEVHRDSVQVEENSSDDVKLHEASESAKDGVVEDNSSNSETQGNQNQIDKRVNREPPSFGTFTRFTIDHILNSAHSCKTNDIKTCTSTNSKRKNLSRQFATGWIYKNSPQSLELGKNQTDGLKSFHFSNYDEHNRPGSPSSSESDETLDSLSVDQSGTTEGTDDPRTSPDTNHQSEYSWLHCTRYKPPKLPSKHIRFL